MVSAMRWISVAVSCITPIIVVPRAPASASSSTTRAVQGVVQRGGRLVQQEQARLGHQRAGEVDALLLAAAEEDRVAVPEFSGSSSRSNSSATRSRACAETPRRDQRAGREIERRHARRRPQELGDVADLVGA